MPNKEYLRDVKRKFPFSAVKEEINNLKNLKVMVIGEAIIDEYVFTIPKGRATKDPILSLDFVKKECYPGGILATSNHISDFVDKVSVVTLLGDRQRKEEFVRTSLSKNISPIFFTKKESPTIHKRRYIDFIRSGKLFKVEYINDAPIDKETEAKIIDYLKEKLPKFDITVVGDFGHGFITDKIVKTIQKYSKFLAANVQTNSSNMGFNYMTKFDELDYLASNEPEIRFALADKHNRLHNLIRKLKEIRDFKKILLTTGVKGCLYIKNNEIHSGPVLTTTTKDVVGAGDAVFAVTSLLSYKDVNEELLVFIANCVGAIAVNIMGNKEKIKKGKLLSFIEDTYDALE